MGKPPRDLKENLTGELDNAWIVGSSSDRAERLTGGKIDVRICEVRGIRKIEELRTEVKAYPFSNRKGPLQGKVDVALRRPAQEAGAAVPEVGVRRRNSERSDRSGWERRGVEIMPESTLVYGARSHRAGRWSCRPIFKVAVDRAGVVIEDRQRRA